MVPRGTGHVLCKGPGLRVGNEMRAPIGRFSACQAAERHLSRGCGGAIQSALWAVVKWLTGTDEVVDQALKPSRELRGIPSPRESKRLQALTRSKSLVLEEASF